MDPDTPSRQAALPGMVPPPEAPPKPHHFVGALRTALAARSPDVVDLAERAVTMCPANPEILLLATLAQLAAHRPERALPLLKRYDSGKRSALLKAVALAQQGDMAHARDVLRDARLDSQDSARAAFVGDAIMVPWLFAHLAEIKGFAARPAVRAAAPKAATGKPATPKQAGPKAGPPRKPAATAKPVPAAVAPILLDVPELPRRAANFNIAFDLPNAAAIDITGDDAPPDAIPFRLRGNLMRLSLFEGFDDLLCLNALRGVEPHWYQIETVRKVLKKYRGRVLLADEVGLGKTIEAGMVLKEYLLRGMADRVLILTPASLVGQWRDEMDSKFGIPCATSHDALLRQNPAQFWAQKRVIASIAVARRKEHADLLGNLSYDVVVVDEAHHVRDQSSASYRLINALQKRFLLLLSATPVQNSLLELYNLLTLLQPGIFKTQKEFRAAYMVAGKPREPANRDRLRELMRGVMVRNTRALAALRMPRRHASTLRATPDAAEAACYEELAALVRELAAAKDGPGAGTHAMSLQHLLAAAGSSPAAAAAAVQRFSERRPGDARWSALLARLRGIAAGAKEAALLRLLAQNPTEKKLVFVHHRDSLAHLAEKLAAAKMSFAHFSGGMSGPEKDAAVDAFRDSVPILLCTESGGEGRNLQFCNTLINFDIPWNPMAIEQRIGRIDRIGQTREVFVFNLVTAGTIEDAVLRILDEKINMFELVVGEVGAILGEVDESQEFSTLVLNAWLEGTEQGRADAFARIETQLLAARQEYETVKQFDDALFGNELDAA